MQCCIVSCIASWYCFFFFKQKTAYEMRISDWSSDVCSSDLLFKELAHRRAERLMILSIGRARQNIERHRLPFLVPDRGLCSILDLTFTSTRSEEHTSELQSLMRISYAVFCLKKKQVEYR